MSLQRLQVGEQRADAVSCRSRASISFRSAVGSRPAVSGHRSRAERVSGVGLAGHRRVVFLDQDRVVAARIGPSVCPPIRSRRALRRSAGCRAGIGAAAWPGTPADRASEPIRCAGTAPAPRCRAACRPCIRWCPPPRAAACRGSTRRVAPASRLAARTSRRPAVPWLFSRRCGRPPSPARPGRSATRWCSPACDSDRRRASRPGRSSGCAACGTWRSSP